MHESKSSGKRPLIDLTVKNGTSQTVFKAHFKTMITNVDRSIIWSQVSWVYLMSRGLEPGEEATWYLTSVMISDKMRNIFMPSDAVFTLADVVLTVTFVQLDDQDGEPIYSTRQFSESDQEWLNHLKEKYGIK